jgi:hypothetical protein
MQTSGSGHASRASEFTAGLAAFCAGSAGLTAANSTGGVAGCGIRGGSGEAALPIPVLATSTEAAASLTSFCCGSGVLNDAIATGTAAGRGIGGGSDKGALPLAISATEAPRPPDVVARDASTCSARAVARPTFRAPVLSMPSGPRPASPATTQLASATVPYNAANTASRRSFFTPVPLKFLREAMADLKVQSMTTSNPTGPRRVAQRG